jgi:hypothetical protein
MSRRDKIDRLHSYCSGRRCEECIFDEDPGCAVSDLANKTDSEIDTLFERLPDSKSLSVYWSNICEMQERQTEKGLKKYGQVLEENTAMTILERLEYLQEELIDGLMYIEHIKASIDKMLTKEGSTNE